MLRGGPPGGGEVIGQLRKEPRARKPVQSRQLPLLARQELPDGGLSHMASLNSLPGPIEKTAKRGLPRKPCEFPGLPLCLGRSSVHRSSN